MCAYDFTSDYANFKHVAKIKANFNFMVYMTPEGLICQFKAMMSINI